MFLLVLQRLCIEFLFDLVYFPLWWYTSGAKKALLFCGRLISDANRNMAPGLWLKNIFVPMFGQNDIAGRFTSFLVRLANVIARAIALLIWILIVFALFFLWLLFPVFVVSMLLVALF